MVSILTPGSNTHPNQLTRKLGLFPFSARRVCGADSNRDKIQWRRDTAARSAESWSWEERSTGTAFAPDHGKASERPNEDAGAAEATHVPANGEAPERNP